MDNIYNSYKGTVFILLSIFIMSITALSGCDKAKDMDTIAFDNKVKFDKNPKAVECGDGDVFNTKCLVL